MPKYVYVIFESDRGDSEIKGVVSTEKKAEEWLKEQFTKALRQRRVIEQDETVEWEILPDGWKLPSGYSYDDYSCFYEEWVVS